MNFSFMFMALSKHVSIKTKQITIRFSFYGPTHINDAILLCYPLSFLFKHTYVHTVYMYDDHQTKIDDNIAQLLDCPNTKS